jgi:hypothetical protein
VGLLVEHHECNAVTGIGHLDLEMDRPGRNRAADREIPKLGCVQPASEPDTLSLPVLAIDEDNEALAPPR